MSSTLLCFIPGGKSVFSVEIDKTKIVDQLKKAIKEKKKQTLANVEADALILYRVAIDPTLDNDQQETTLTQLSENWGEANKLINTSYLSALHYDHIFGQPMLQNRDYFNHNKEPHIHYLLYALGFHVHQINGNQKACLQFGHSWDFRLMVQLPELKRRKYTPKSDASLRINKVPHLLLEVISDTAHSDCTWMLLQAACVARLGNALRSDQEPFIVSAIYIDETLIATWYCVYQPEKTDRAVKYMKERFDLRSAMNTFKFIFQLYNFVSRAQEDNSTLQNPFDRVAKLDARILEMGLDSLKGRKRKTRDDDEGDDGAGNGSPKKRQNDGGGAGNGSSARQQTDGGLAEDDTTFDVAIQEALLAGYTIPDEVEGFEPLFPPKEQMFEAVSVHGEPVIFKLTDRHEVEVLRRLHANRSTKPTRIIPLLDVVDGRLLVLPQRTPLMEFLDFDASVGDVELLALQFLEGVAYLQLSSVAHLDLKPDNIVVQWDRDSKKVALNLIDFDISVFANAELTISESIGTDGWSAPEVSAGKPYNPLLADRWSCGRVLEFLVERMKPSRVRETMHLCSRQWMDPDPSLRPHVADVVSSCLQGMGGMLTTTKQFPVSRATRPMERELQARASPPVF